MPETPTRPTPPAMPPAFTAALARGMQVWAVRVHAAAHTSVWIAWCTDTPAGLDVLAMDRAGMLLTAADPAALEGALGFPPQRSPRAVDLRAACERGRTLDVLLTAWNLCLDLAHTPLDTAAHTALMAVSAAHMDAHGVLSRAVLADALGGAGATARRESAVDAAWDASHAAGERVLAAGRAVFMDALHT